MPPLLILKLQFIIILVRSTFAEDEEYYTIDYNKGLFNDDDPFKEPEKGLSYNEGCVKLWLTEGRVFLKWLVRIMVKEESSDFRFDAGTGSLITTRHVLTACDPLYTRYLVGRNPREATVWPIVIKFGSDNYVNFKKGQFPWSTPRGCVPEYYEVATGIYPRGKCTNDGNIPFEDLTNNFIILTLVQVVTIPQWSQWQRMPFDFNLDRTLNTLRWFQSYRKARCAIPRFKRLPGKDKFPNPEIEQEGFTYRTMEYGTDCTRLLCKAHCENKPNAQECIIDCARNEAYKWHGKIMCLQRMKENIKAPRKFTVNWDFQNSQSDWTQKEQCELSSIYGAPVMCFGDVVAMVTYCHAEFLAATPIFSIRHQIFRHYATRFQDAMLFMDGSNETVSSTEGPEALPSSDYA